MKKNSLFISNFKDPQIHKLILTLSIFMLFILLSIIVIIIGFDRININKVFNNELERKTDRLLSTDVQIVIAGDSRAEVQLVPSLFEKTLKKKTINIALPACDLATTVNVLKLKKLLNQKRIFIISTSIFQINDNIDDIGYISNALICKLTLLEKIRLFYKRPQQIFQAYTRGATYLLNNIVNKPFSKNSPSLYSSGKGFRAAQGNINMTNIYKITLTPDKTQHIWYRNIKLDGAKWRVFTELLNYLGRQPIKVILFQAPSSPIWKQYTRDSFIEKAEQQYTIMLKQQVSKYSNIIFLDFYNYSAELTNELFFDAQHLNEQGAKTFSEMFIRKMRINL